MAEVILFHHVAGLTDGVRSFADRLRARGHTVHTPDLFDGETAPTIEEGLALVGRIGDEVLQSRGLAALAGTMPDTAAGTAATAPDTMPAVEESPIAVLSAEIALLHARLDDLQSRLDRG